MNFKTVSAVASGVASVITYLLNASTATNMYLFPVLEVGNGPKKSAKYFSQGLEDLGICINPYVKP